MNAKDKKLIEFVEFVATKFSVSREGWVYSRDLGDLKHIRYGSDYTGYNHWSKRVQRAFDPKRLTNADSLFGPKNNSLKERAAYALAWIRVSLEKESNLPDGQINGIPVNWEEDGEYLAHFQPRVGVKVLEFLKAEPENPYARAILDEMHACAELSWPSDAEATDEDAAAAKFEDEGGSTNRSAQAL
jgi:hypothetical protein